MRSQSIFVEGLEPAKQPILLTSNGYTRITAHDTNKPESVAQLLGYGMEESRGRACCPSLRPVTL